MPGLWPRTRLRLLAASPLLLMAFSVHALEVGDPAPGFALADTNGVVHDLADYRGRVAILNFFGYSCVPCREQGDTVETDLHQPYAGEWRVALLGIEQFNGSTFGVRNFAEVTGATYPILTQGYDTSLLYNGGKRYVVVDPEGLVAYISAEYELDVPRIRQVADSLAATVELPEGRDPTRPTGFRIAAAWPNPFNSTLRVQVELPAAAQMEVAVFDLLGRRVAILHKGTLPAGAHPLTWHPEGAAGVYIVRLTGPGGVKDARRVVLVR